MLTLLSVPQGVLSASADHQPSGVVLRCVETSDRHRQALQEGGPGNRSDLEDAHGGRPRFRRLKAPEPHGDVYLGAEYGDGVAIEANFEEVAARRCLHTY